MVTVTGAWAAHGYSGWDHLIDDDAVRGLIGREYRSLGAASADAYRVYAASGPDRRVAGVPIRVEVRLRSGEIRSM